MLNENITFNKKIIFFNKCFDKKQLKLLIYWFLTHLDESKTLKFIENLKELGFKYATKIGISISIDDLKIPFLKYKSIYTNEKETLNLELNLDAGYITKVEKVKRFIELWHRLSENLKNEVVQYFQITDIFNPVYMMLFSGARGNISQIRQLIAMRGLMSDPQGEIIDFPIRSNFREGLTLTEYIISCYGARKGIVDTALRTAKSGYLTRRLVDIAHHVIICKQDCKTNRGIWIKDLYDKNKIVLKLKDRIIGRVLAENIVYENSDLLIGLKNQEISFILADKLLNNIDYLKKKIFIRSPLTCLSPHAICQLCYGWNLAANKLVSLGEAVGVLAAQSIGEPGTQLTMRTFHTGGVFSGTLIDQLTSPFKGQIFFPEHCDGLLVRTLQAKIGFLTKRQGILKIKSYNTEDIKKFNFIFPIHTLLFVKNKEFVNKMQVIAELPGLISKSFENEKQIKNKFSGQLYFENLSLIEKIKNENNIKFFVKDLGSIWVLMGVYFKALFSSETFFHKRDLINSKVLCQKFNIRNNGFSVIDSIDLESNQNIKILINKYFKIKDNIKNNIKEILFLKPYISFYLFNIFLFKKIGYFNYLKINSIKKYFLWNILSIKNDIFYYWYYKIYNKDSKNNILSWTSGIKFFKIKNKVWFRFLNDYKLNINNSLYNSFQIINKNLFNFTIINHKNLINKLTCNFSNKNYFIISKNRQGFNQINELKYIFLFYTKTIKPNNKIFKISKNKFNLSYLDIKLNKTFNYSIFSFFKNFFFSKLISFNYDVKLYYKSYKFNNKKLLIFNWKNFIFKKINFKFLKFYKFIFLKYYFLNTNNFKYNKLKTNQIFKNLIGFNSFLRVFVFFKFESNFNKFKINLNKSFKQIEFLKTWLAISNFHKNEFKKLNKKNINFILTKKIAFFCLNNSFLREKKIKLKKINYFFNFKRRFNIIIQKKVYLKKYNKISLSFSKTINLVIQNKKKSSIFSLSYKNKIFEQFFFPEKLNFNKYFINLFKKKLIYENNKNYDLKLLPIIKLKNKLVKNELTNKLVKNELTNKLVKNKLTNKLTNKLVKNKLTNKLVKNELKNKLVKTKLTNKLVKNKLTNKLTNKLVKNKLTNKLVKNKLTNKLTNKLVKNELKNKLVKTKLTNKLTNKLVKNKLTNKLVKNKLINKLIKNIKNRSKIKFSDFNRHYETIEFNYFNKSYLKINNYFPIIINKNNIKIQNILQKTQKMNLNINYYNYLKIENLFKIYKFRDQFTKFKINQSIKYKNFLENEISFSYFLNCNDAEVIKTTLQTLTPKTSKILIWKNEQIAILILDNFNTFFIKTFKNKIFYKMKSFLRFGKNVSKNRLSIDNGQIIAITNRGIVVRKAESFLLKNQSILHIKHREIIDKNTSLFTVFFSKIKTGDIIQGITKIEQIFEARELYDKQKLNHRLLRRKRSKNINIFNRKIQKYIRINQLLIVNKIQRIYRSQGIIIADKHLEIIVCQMTSKVAILNGRQSGLLSGELVNLIWIEKINKRFAYNKLNFLPLILGITQTSLETSSFISAASFQETTRILGKAAIQNKIDFTRGLKQNVIFGSLIPAGTGFFLSNQINFFEEKNEIKENNTTYNVDNKKEKTIGGYNLEELINSDQEDIIFSNIEI